MNSTVNKLMKRMMDPELNNNFTRRVNKLKPDLTDDDMVSDDKAKQAWEKNSESDKKTD
ncbi:hypothetical protein MKZ01_14060 [Lysinibacillus endophyticus]|uniref:hypothetical protein n=1 Tax=Ureibacillus endophyticus TaxID=1978490 RepID=UPI0031363534